MIFIYVVLSILLILRCKRKFLTVSLLACLAGMFTYYASIDRRHFLQDYKQQTALSNGLTFMLQDHAINSTPNDFMNAYPGCCNVSPFYMGVAPSRDARNLRRVVEDKLFSLTGLEMYLVTATMPESGRVASIIATGLGGLSDYQRDR
jgi:hypothetical protein